MTLTTKPSVDGRGTEAVIATVKASSFGEGHPIDVWKIESKMVMAKLQGQADILGADAVVDAHFQMKRQPNGITIVHGEGKAVKLTPIQTA